MYYEIVKYGVFMALTEAEVWDKIINKDITSYWLNWLSERVCDNWIQKKKYDIIGVKKKKILCHEKKNAFIMTKYISHEKKFDNLEKRFLEKKIFWMESEFWKCDKV